MDLESPAARTGRLLRDQANACAALGSPLYADLLRAAAEDLVAGGPTLAVLAGHLSDPGPSAVALRMLAGAHALVLTGGAPGLAAFYPSAGGRYGGDADAAWRALSEVFELETGAVRSWLERPPQTNEVGRGAALIGALGFALAEAQLPVRLIELGTSAGLNLRADRFHVDGEVASYGNVDSPVQLRGAWIGRSPPVGAIDVVERIGVDLTPIDPTTAAGALALTAYVWPDQLERLERLRGALALAAQFPAELRQESAATLVDRMSLVEGTWTVVWHSVFQQYLDPAERRHVESGLSALGDRADPGSRLARISLEPERRARWRGHEFLVALTTWPGGERRILGVAAPHGVPVTWEPDPG